MVMKEIPLTNIIACIMNGAPAICSIYQGFIAHLIKEVLGIFTAQCVVHWQYLIAKSMSNQLHAITKAMNKMKGLHSIIDSFDNFTRRIMKTLDMYFFLKRDELVVQRQFFTMILEDLPLGIGVLWRILTLMLVI